MPTIVVIDGTPVTYYSFDEQVAVERGPDPGDPVTLLPGEAFTCTGVNGSPLTPLHPVTKDPIPLVTLEPGVIPVMLLPELRRVVSVNGLTFTRSSDDVADLAQAAAADRVSANASRIAAESALQKVEDYIASGGGGTGGTSLTPEQEAILAAFDPSVATGEAGQALLWDAELGAFRPGPLPTPTVTAGDITAGTLSHARLPEGVMVLVDKATGGFGAPAGSWPTTDPVGNPDLVVVWQGDRVGTDGPGAVMAPGDQRVYTDPA